MKDKFIIINDDSGEVLNGTNTEDCLKAMIVEEIIEPEYLLIYKLYATISPMEIKLVGEAK